MSSSPWKRALVTGASSGIGLAFARALAGEGSNLVIVARRAERLENLANELRRAHRVEVEVIPADLANPRQLARVEQRLEDATNPVDLLVNNAGLGTVGRFADRPIEGEENAIRVNVLALVRLTHAALPGMIARHRGGVLNLASTVAFMPEPFGATYSATKAYVLNFSEAISEELRGSGVRVTALCPGFTHTEFHDRPNDAKAPGETDRGSGEKMPEALWMSADEVARAGLDALRKGKVVAVPGLLYAAAAGLMSALPRGVVRRISGAAMRTLRKEK
ncbi:MAG: SDR family oxidoreductase [Actinomycetota bacterium]